MKITDEYAVLTKDTEVIDITSARYIGDHAIRLTFIDGFEKLVNFKPFLSKSLHPSLRKYRDENLFSKFEIIDGNLNWNDYDLIFPIDDLYNDKI